MSSDIAIRVQNVSKFFQIYASPTDRLKQFFFPQIQKFLNLESKDYFTKFWALKDVSFVVTKGSSLGILGLNGAGKSTLLQIVCGTLTATSGTVEKKGRVAALLELGAGFNPEFTGLENVYLNGSILGLTKKQIDAKLPLILDFADIGDFIYQPVKTYSSGMYVRLAFAIAVHTDPDILVIDEALAVGDFLFQQKCNLFFKEKLSGITKIFVSHDIGAIANMTDTALVLRQGELIFYGDSQNAIQAYQIASRSTNIETKISSIRNTANLANDSERFVSEKFVIEDLQMQVESQEWVHITQSSLSGSLDSSVLKFMWQVNGKWNINLVTAGDILDFFFLIDSRSEIQFPIIGYQVQDRYGCVVFGQNTVDSEIAISAIRSGKSMARLRIRWPEISNGKYSLTLGIGAGSHGEAHHILCWAHNIITFDSVAGRTVHGVFNNKILELQVAFNEK